MKTKRLNITIEKKLADELNRLSKEMNEKKSHIIEKALLFYLDFLDVSIAEQRLEKLKKGKTKLIPAEKVYRELKI